MLLLAIPIAIGVFTWSVAREGRRQSMGVRHALQVELLLERLMSHLKDAETSQRGYLLTAEPRYLEACHSAGMEARHDLDALSSLTERLQEPVARMRPLVQARLDHLDFTLELYHSGKLDRQTAVTSLDRGKELMDSVKALGDEMLGVEDRVLHERELAWSRISTFFFWSLGAGYVVIVLLVASLYRNVKRYGRQTAEAEERLRGLNTELDQRVQDRTVLLEAREQELRTLAGNLLTAQEDERRRVARELHDDVTQRLAFLSIELGKLAAEIPDALIETRSRVRQLQEQTLCVSHEVRRVSHGLHPSVIADFGLGIALEAFCEEFEKSQGVQVKFEGLIEDSQLDPAAATSLYRVAQESMRNAVIHGHATELRVELTLRDHSLQLAVRDNGAGFSSNELRARPGLGVTSMRERMRLVNGAFSLSSEQGRGAEMLASVPLQRVENGKHANLVS